VLAAGVAVLIAWALRAHAEFLPSGRPAPRLSPASGHGHGGGAGVVEPPPVAGEALAHYAGLTMVALHVVLVGVVVVACGVRRWLSPGLLARVAFAGAVAVAAALTTLVLAAVLLDAAITFPATLAAAVTVLRYGFVFVIVSSTVLGVP
jgi:hypothetical protein